jgi:excisionase family DNA binding protein
MDNDESLLTPGEVAKRFRVDPKTVSRWALAGRIGSIRTPGGHRRYRASEVRQLLESGLVERSTPSRLEEIAAEEKREEAEANALLVGVFSDGRQPQ